MAFSDPHSPAWEPMLCAAWRAWERAYAPYSRFRVGAALAWAEDTVTVGCNVENASYPLCLCAERAALVAAVSQGMALGGLRALVVVSEAPELTPPCGACRQALVEFADDLPILLANRTDRSLCRLGDLLPRAFTGRHLPGPPGQG